MTYHILFIGTGMGQSIATHFSQDLIQTVTMQYNTEELSEKDLLGALMGSLALAICASNSPFRMHHSTVKWLMVVLVSVPFPMLQRVYYKIQS